MIYDLIVIGGGAAGIFAAIKAKEQKKSVLLLEQQLQIAPKLKATGGGRCNLTNTLPNDQFAQKFGKNNRFVLEVIQKFDNNQLQIFLDNIGVQTHSPDKFRVFPLTHSSQTVIDALLKYMQQLSIDIKCNHKVIDIKIDNQIKLITTKQKIYKAKNIVIATGGKGYPKLGSSGDGFVFGAKLGHMVTKLYPAMMPLFTKEKWVAKCTADTLAKVTISVDIKKYKKLKATGDLIFTKHGIRGPVVLDFAREITPLFDKYNQIPIKLDILKGKNQNDIIELLKTESAKYPNITVLDILSKIVAKSVLIELSNIVDIDLKVSYKALNGKKKNDFLQLLSFVPLTIVGHDGFRLAMITRGGISLKHINPKTMESRLVPGVYFAGEVVDIDGPCGGYNLQWAFSSGYLAGSLSELI